jgi:hypothetical protein
MKIWHSRIENLDAIIMQRTWQKCCAVDSFFQLVKQMAEEHRVQETEPSLDSSDVIANSKNLLNFGESFWPFS